MRIRGKIVNVSDRGFCFLWEDGRKKNIFCHAYRILNRPFDLISVGDRVEFDLDATNPNNQARDQRHGVVALNRSRC
ncbi:MAG TPA: cold shock domain-containing protein [Vicinamibacterales bacterium]|nr:cold shock domain-containing protein [Vicinamibacterales bacterium]